MHTDEFIELYKQAGFSVIKTKSCFWYNAYHGPAWFSFPFHLPIEPTRAEIEEVFRQSPKALILRFISPLAYPAGIESYLWIRYKPYDLEVLEPYKRTKTKRGLNRCSVRRLTWEELSSLGWEAQQSTLVRQNRFLGKTHNPAIDPAWTRCPAFECWGAFAEQKLAAYIVAMQVENCMEFIAQRSNSAFHKFYPNNAVVFTAVKEFLNRPEISSVCLGWEAIEPHESLDYFKESMGFQRMPVRQNIVFRKPYRFILNRKMCQFLEKVGGWWPAGHPVRRFTSVCRLAKHSLDIFS